MALYLISYDISEKDVTKNQSLNQCLSNFLKEMGAKQILPSLWVMSREGIGEAHELYKQVKSFGMPPGPLLIQGLLKDAAWDKLLIGTDAFQKLLESARTIDPIR
jgi:hypothetical protein